MTILAHGIRVLEDSCRGCVNCIKSCPTEAMRVIHGRAHIIEELCIACGECLRNCRHRALQLAEDPWESISNNKDTVALMVDPSLCTQFLWPPNPDFLIGPLRDIGLEPISGVNSEAFDLAALAVSRAIESADSKDMPLISTYCPAVVRLIQIRFPELLKHLVPVESPLEFGIDLWRIRTQQKESVVLAASCPARIAMVHDPVGREVSSAEWAVSVARLAKEIRSRGYAKAEIKAPAEGERWVQWGMLGGETLHVASFMNRHLNAIAVSGIRNVFDLLQEVELGLHAEVEFVEARICDTGCIGGIGNAESRFLSQRKIRSQKVRWERTAREIEMLEKLYRARIWELQREIEPINRLPLGEEISQAMEKLKEMNAVYAELPHIDCGACGRPSCRAMAEDIVRGRGEVEDCIFKLRKRISGLAEELLLLSRRLVHTVVEDKH